MFDWEEMIISSLFSVEHEEDLKQTLDTLLDWEEMIISSLINLPKGMTKKDIQQLRQLIYNHYGYTYLG